MSCWSNSNNNTRNQRRLLDDGGWYVYPRVVLLALWLVYMATIDDVCSWQKSSRLLYLLFTSKAKKKSIYLKILRAKRDFKFSNKFQVCWPFFFGARQSDLLTASCYVIVNNLSLNWVILSGLKMIAGPGLRSTEWSCLMMR